ncbi:transglutaminase-like domain-containing protein [Frondihabitans cladoniiphilus]|uniref:Transglutaminase-like domain-containing protein n=1 Tax=Frondihabitans cladoniiphilus TaxID=715785 RepID=A0ABP8VK48_9MICO
MTATSSARAVGLRPRAGRARVSIPFAIAQTLAFVVVMALAVVTWWPIYQSIEVVVLVGVGLVLGALIALAGTFLRLAGFWILVATVVAFGLFGVPVAVPSQTTYGVVPTLAGLRELASGAALGWKQLLTITLPVGGYQALLVPLFVLVLPGTVIGLSTALRSRRAELALVPPVVVYLAGIVFGPETGLRPIVTGLALLAASVLWLAWWRLRRRRLAIEEVTLATQGREAVRTGVHRSGSRAFARRAIAGTIVTVLVAAAFSAAATTVLHPAGARLVARSVVAHPFDPRDYDSPLSGFRSYEQSPAVSSTQLRVSGLDSGDFVRIATLDTYDGVQFSVGSGAASSDSGTFTRVPTSFDQSQVNGSQANVAVTVDGYSGVWLPTVGQLETIDFSGSDAATLRDDFFYNDRTGTAAVLGGVSSGVSYRLSGVVPTEPTSAELAAVTPGTDSVPTPVSVPTALKNAVSTYTDGVTGQGARLQAVLAELKKNGYVSHGTGDGQAVSRSGHGSDRLSQLFTDSLMVGDAEQYSAAAALMADQLGFPARVVMGFSATASARTSGSTYDFTGSDITAEIEVDTAQYGWVRLDPNPTPRPIPDQTVTNPDQVTRPQSVVQPPPEVNDPRNNQTPPQSKQDPAIVTPAWLVALLLVGRIAAWVLLVAGLIMAPFLTIVAVKARRRRARKRVREPARRMTAGWEEFHDSVVDHGIPAPPNATRSEVAAVVGGSRPVVLARVVDRAVFAPETTDPADADRVWKAVGEMRAGLDSDLTRWQRFKAAVSLRSLRGYHGRKASQR